MMQTIKKSSFAPIPREIQWLRASHGTEWVMEAMARCEGVEWMDSGDAGSTVDDAMDAAAKRTVFLRTVFADGTCLEGNGFVLGDAALATARHNVERLDGGPWRVQSPFSPTSLPTRIQACFSNGRMVDLEIGDVGYSATSHFVILQLKTALPQFFGLPKVRVKWEYVPSYDWCITFALTWNPRTSACDGHCGRLTHRGANASFACDSTGREATAGPAC